MRLGDYELANPWILAPMAGVSEMPYRVLVREFGAAAAPTELVSAKGLVYGQARTQRYLEHAPTEQPFWVQIFGGDEESMAIGAEHAVAFGARIIDVNMGCPVKKVTKNGAGSALLGDPARAADIVRAIVRRTGVPVTAKIRSGWDAATINAADMTARLADAGCAAVAIHARTRAQGYSGRADWPVIARVVERATIPIIGNGDVRSPADARRMMRETGCAAVMIGRAALGNPWIFRALTDDSFTTPTAVDRWQLVARHLDAHLAFVGDVTRGIRRFRPHLLWYAHGLRGASEFRRAVTHVDELEPLRELCRDFFHGAHAAADDEPLELDLRTALG